MIFRHLSAVAEESALSRADQKSISKSGLTLEFENASIGFFA